MEILVCLQVRKSLRPKGFGLLARLERMEGGIMTPWTESERCKSLQTGKTICIIILV